MTEPPEDQPQPSGGFEPSSAPPPMGEVPTTEAPPLQNVAYPRATPMFFQGTPERLQALADAYFGLNWVFVVSVVLLVGSRVATYGATASTSAPMSDGQIAMVTLGPLLVTSVVVTMMCLGLCRKAGLGLAWGPNTYILIAPVLGLQTCFCCGLVGIGILQHMLAMEMNKYGVPGGMFGGVKKRNIEAAIERMRQAGVAQPTAPPGAYQP